MISREALKQFDFGLFLGTLALALLGSLAVYSAATPSSGAFVRQLAWLGIGITACLAVTCVDYRFVAAHSFAIYFPILALLVAVLIWGVRVNGSTSWILGIGDFARLQPSELAKIAVIVGLAAYLSEIPGNILESSNLIVASAIAGVPVLLIVLQRDLGTALLYIPVLVGMLLVAGLRLKVLVWLLILAIALAPLGWLLLKDYQRERVLVTLYPELDPQGVGYQTRQSLIAIGSGGLLGKGWGQGLQSQLGFVPEIHTDFIFALLAEEAGFLIAAIILALYLFVLMRLINIAENARDRTGMLVVTGVACLIFSQVAINVGMTLGLLPAIGIPLPLLSYGGNSALVTFIAIGFALSVESRRFVY